ncbi:hypothetical protein BOTBODRAFT_463637 [Botryobasidium botryosum FD-172 SS1]|uniref:Uncharacterized protein n=1 Tax=Botryobasidium botryosum (strain FD-172 SS1) TaxID=930990 RepID=A0A067M983_BOTB1|nr:hypothetical protein BOTBODRAFT_463637 [Botryobasidium botryosum FD-172 SS1]
MWVNPALATKRQYCALTWAARISEFSLEAPLRPFYVYAAVAFTSPPSLSLPNFLWLPWKLRMPQLVLAIARINLLRSLWKATKAFRARSD